MIADRKQDFKKAQGYVDDIKKIQPSFTQKELDKQLGMLKDVSLLAEYKQMLEKYGLPRE